MEKDNVKKNVLCDQSLMALLFSLIEDHELDADFLRKSEEIIARKSGLAESGDSGIFCKGTKPAFSRQRKAAGSLP
uniref:hypothetical protein n=1 Tax=Ndongobacter massiliensis TaxID=1871025 RepID=UPI0012FEF4FC|nr:hypothetical protein [Ndongobacter massiliensis]